MKKVVAIHIGQSKTGTTTIQHFFWLNRQACAARGIHYLKTGVTAFDSPAHYGLLHANFSFPAPHPSWCSRNDLEKIESAWAVAKEEIEENPHPIFLVSCESAWLLDNDAIRYIRRLLRGYHVFIVLFLREPASYIVSSYKQALKVGRFLGPFSEFLALRRHLLEYESIVNRWASEFGRANTGVFSYEAMKLDLIGEFLRLLGLELTQFATAVAYEGGGRRANVTPGDGVLHAIKTLHRIQSRVPRLARSPIRHIRRRLAADAGWWLSGLCYKLQYPLLTAGDVEFLGTLPNNKDIAFDSIEGFSNRIRAATATD